MKKAYKRRHHGRAGANPAFPARMVLTVSFVISPVIGLSCHRRLADISARLDASVETSGPHDFAVRSPWCSSGTTPRVHRIPHPTFVTIAKRPS
jgi:hypothetical protein